MSDLSPDQREALDALGAIWARHPQLRLGQLIGNIHVFDRDRPGIDPYYLADDAFVDAIEAVYARQVL